MESIPTPIGKTGSDSLRRVIVGTSCAIECLSDTYIIAQKADMNNFVKVQMGRGILKLPL